LFAPVDLIILDLMLGGKIDGVDIFDRIRALPVFNQVPIIGVSAMDSAIAIPLLQRKGFNGFIAKPIDNELFPKQLLQIMAGEALWYDGKSYF
jgi:CheY-like chemotaxis protein